MVKVRKVQASSMAEVLVAMTILMVIMLIAFSVLVSVNNYTNPSIKMNAHLECNREINTLKFNSEIKEIINKGNIRIVRHIEHYRGNANLLLVNIIAVSPNGLILCRKNAVIAKKNLADED
jgi:Tfp pilus assembly protein PilV